MNNKKMIAGVLSALTALALLPGIAGAVEIDTTTSSPDTTTAATADPNAIPTACTEPVDIEPLGPARAAHSPAARPSGEAEEVLPTCGDVEGICVELILPEPPLTTTALKTNNIVSETTEVPCVPIDPACDIVVDLTITGPARAAHQPALPPKQKVAYVEIPEACQEALSLAALPDSGSDSATIMWLGAALVIVGGALVLTRRTALVRTR